MTRTFSRQGYLSLLTLAKDVGYDIRPMREAWRVDGDLPLLLRHDVDFSLRLALDMAQLENEREIRSTYYILPHNDFYAPFSPEGRRSLSSLIALGHEVGLHWDSTVYSEDASAFRRAIQRDIDMLEDIIGQKVVSASQHNPIDSRFVDLTDLFEVEAYSPRIRERFTYISDSAMSWRAKTPWELLPERKDLQLLIHPIWWMAPGDSRQDKFGHLKQSGADHDNAKLDDMLAYIERCLADRERLDARVAAQWRAAQVQPASGNPPS